MRLNNLGSSGRPRTLRSRQIAVERAEAYLRSHMDAPVPVSRLCRVVGLSERALRNAFYTVRGMSPKRCIVAVRLEGVRRALIKESNKPVTITSVATRYGFYELGRFANSYRQAFGENPSATLRGTVRDTLSARKEHRHAGTP
jgi:transcriptional regulator GlxA family with amidase domain